jgi:hypothetical protein
MRSIHFGVLFGVNFAILLALIIHWRALAELRRRRLAAVRTAPRRMAVRARHAVRT